MSLRMDLGFMIASKTSRGWDLLSPNVKKILAEGALPLVDQILDRIGVVELENRPDGILQVHKRKKCEGQRCSVHNPSDHPLRHMPQVWDPVRGMRRLCIHGVEHPDPDHIYHLWAIDEVDAVFDAIHGCDGCCDQEGAVRDGRS